MAATKDKPDIVTGWLAPGTSKALHFANKSMCTHLGKGSYSVFQEDGQTTIFRKKDHDNKDYHMHTTATLHSPQQWNCL